VAELKEPPAPSEGSGEVSRWRRYSVPGAAAIGALLLIVFAWTVITWPDVNSLASDFPDSTAFIDRYREIRRAEGADESVAWTPVPDDRISVNLKRAVIASEDTEFFFHEGFSSHELRESIRKAIADREAPRGASTITQQLAKNLWLAPDRTLTRKLREALLTKQLERSLGKERILDLYLNVVEFGPGIYGAEAAARHYFEKPADRLTIREGAMLAAGLPRPKSWNPSSGSENYARRVDRILEIEGDLEFLDRYFGTGTP
jgi:monofunctional biosynthetic peptidoglycan transglycosylase